MKLADAEALLRALGASDSTTRIEVGTRGQPPHNYAYLKLVSSSDPEDFAIVSTPGDGWFQLEVAGGFLTGTTSDLTDDNEVREYLELYLRAAKAYLEGRRTTGKSRLFRIPFVKVQADDGPLTLRLPVDSRLRHVFGGR